MKFRHYGTDNYEETRVKPISNIPCFTKPSGGLWASPIKMDGTAWEEWCEQEDFYTHKLNTYFDFVLHDDARVLQIHTIEQLTEIEKNYSVITSTIKPDIFPFDSYTLDFEAIAKEYDAIDFRLSNDQRLYWALYGWDCDSILVLNPKAIKLV